MSMYTLGAHAAGASPSTLHHSAARSPPPFRNVQWPHATCQQHHHAWTVPYITRSCVLRAQPHKRRSRHRSACVAVQAALGGRFNLAEAVKKELGVQTSKLPNDVRERVERAVEELRFRATAGDVAARAGVKVSEANRALEALAYDSLGTLEVSAEGDVVFVIPSDFRLRIRAKSLKLRAQPLVEKAGKVGYNLLRLAFGSTLLASVVAVWLAIMALMLAASSSRDDNRRDSSFGGGGGGGFMSPRIYLNVGDLLWPRYDPYSDRRSGGADEGMNFLQAIFSFVFGDGDPNKEFEERRYKALGRRIQELGGVVTAEELAPFLDPVTSATSGRVEGYGDEAFVLPALLRFGGEPIVDEDTGDLLYRFPSLQVTAAQSSAASAAAAGRRRAAAGRSGQLRTPATELLREDELQREGGEQALIAQEADIEFTAASPGQQFGTVMLGVANVAGVAILTNLLADPSAKLVLAQQGFQLTLSLLPIFQAYAAAFFAIPALRWFFNRRRNADIAARNDARVDAARLLAAPSRTVVQKMAAARRQGGRRMLREEDAVFSSGREADAQMNVVQAEEWDAQLRASASQDSGW